MKALRHIIIAPHADDEIIGCHSILLQGTVSRVVFPSGTRGAQEVEKARTRFGFTVNQFGNSSDLFTYAEEAIKNKGMIFIPDPVYEYHPEHRRIGHIGEQVAKKLGNVVFYSTKMNAPYIRESKIPTLKKRDLDECYPEKKSLWEYDHRYFLFEGFNIWGIPISLL